VVDLGWRQSSALDDVVGTSARLGSRVGALAARDIEDVELAASGGLNSVFDGRIMRDMVSIHNILDQSFSLLFLCIQQRRILT
jgi:hypothetical protein